VSQPLTQVRVQADQLKELKEGIAIAHSTIQRDKACQEVVQLLLLRGMILGLAILQLIREIKDTPISMVI